MALQIRQIIRPQKTDRPEKQASVNQILRASYQRFTKDKDTRRAVNLFLRRADS